MEPPRKREHSYDLAVAHDLRVTVRTHAPFTKADAMIPAIDHILVPIDFEPASEVALDYAITIARRFNAAVHLLHVVDDPVAGAAAWGADFYVVGATAARDWLVDNAATKLSARRARVEAAGVAARSEVRTGRAADVIPDVADTRGFDLIVMGTHGRSGLAHLLIGSVAEQTMRRARCPILAIRAAATGLTTADTLVEETPVSAW